MRLHISALGCRLNEAEIEALARQAQADGHVLVGEPADADWAVINTCTVTHVAARKSRQAIRRLHVQAPQARIAVLGCFGTVSPQEALALPGVALVIPNGDKDRALSLIEAAGADEPFPRTWPGQPASTRTRAFIKIQDGCDNHCTYCIVRTARGPSRSRPYEQVLADVRARLMEGAREVVLSGVNIGAYGRDLAAERTHPTLATLVESLLDETDVPRLRLSSLEPWDLDADLLALWPHPRLCRQLHLPLQSGSDEVLRRMGRRSTVREYRSLVDAIRSRVPDVALTTDVIAGFPGESEADWQSTCTLVQELGLARLHVFRFSARPGTPAASFPHRVPVDVAQTRARELSSLGTRLSRAYHARFVGQKVTVLFEQQVTRNGVGGWLGLTDNYLHVWVPSEVQLHNQMRDVHCTGASGGELEGVLTE